MKTPHKIILAISVLLVALICVHEYKYDYNPYPMTIGEYIFEIVVVGGLYTVIIFFILFGMYEGLRSLFRLVRKVL